jgi:hypothetical protein
MISKSVIVFWSVACLTLFIHLAGKDPELTAYFILGMGFMWALVVLPTALIGRLFKSKKVYSTKMRLLRGGVLTAVGLITFVIAHASQQPSVTKAQNNPPKEKVTMQSPTPAVLRNGSTPDISAMVTTYRQNEARFRHEYVGRLFSGRMRLSRVSENVIGETTRVDFGSVHCNLPRGSNRAIIAWNKGDEIEIRGTIKDVWFGSVELERCSFR